MSANKLNPVVISCSVFLQIMLALLLNGCVSTVLPEYVLKDDAASQTITSNGLRITVRPLFDRRESEAYFGRNLLEDNIIAIFIKAENLDSSRYYMIRKEDIDLSATGSGNDDVVTGKASESSQSNASNYGGVYSSISMLGAQLAINESRKEYAFRASEFSTQTIGPGSETQGFVYFRNGNKNGKSGTMKLQVMAINPVDNSSSEFKFNIHTPGAM